MYAPRGKRDAQPKMHINMWCDAGRMVSGGLKLPVELEVAKTTPNKEKPSEIKYSSPPKEKEPRKNNGKKSFWQWEHKE